MSQTIRDLLLPYLARLDDDTLMSITAKAALQQGLNIQAPSEQELIEADAAILEASAGRTAPPTIEEQKSDFSAESQPSVISTLSQPKAKSMLSKFTSTLLSKTKGPAESKAAKPSQNLTSSIDTQARELTKERQKAAASGASTEQIDEKLVSLMKQKQTLVANAPTEDWLKSMIEGFFLRAKKSTNVDLSKITKQINKAYPAFSLKDHPETYTFVDRYFNEMRFKYAKLDEEGEKPQIGSKKAIHKPVNILEQVEKASIFPGMEEPQAVEVEVEEEKSFAEGDVPSLEEVREILKNYIHSLHDSQLATFSMNEVRRDLVKKHGVDIKESYSLEEYKELKEYARELIDEAIAGSEVATIETEALAESFKDVELQLKTKRAKDAKLWPITIPNIIAARPQTYEIIVPKFQSISYKTNKPHADPQYLEMANLIDGTLDRLYRRSMRVEEWIVKLYKEKVTTIAGIRELLDIVSQGIIDGKEALEKFDEYLNILGEQDRINDLIAYEVASAEKKGELFSQDKQEAIRREEAQKLLQAKAAYQLLKDLHNYYISIFNVLNLSNGNSTYVNIWARGREQAAERQAVKLLDAESLLKYAAERGAKTAAAGTQPTKSLLAEWKAARQKEVEESMEEQEAYEREIQELKVIKDHGSVTCFLGSLLKQGIADIAFHFNDYTRLYTVDIGFLMFFSELSTYQKLRFISHVADTLKSDIDYMIRQATAEEKSCGNISSRADYNDAMKKFAADLTSIQSDSWVSSGDNQPIVMDDLKARVDWLMFCQSSEDAEKYTRTFLRKHYKISERPDIVNIFSSELHAEGLLLTSEQTISTQEISQESAYKAINNLFSNISQLSRLASGYRSEGVEILLTHFLRLPVADAQYMFDQYQLNPQFLLKVACPAVSETLSSLKKTYDKVKNEVLSFKERQMKHKTTISGAAARKEILSDLDKDYAEQKISSEAVTFIKTFLEYYPDLHALPSRSYGGLARLTRLDDFPRFTLSHIIRAGAIESEKMKNVSVSMTSDQYKKIADDLALAMVKKNFILQERAEIGKLMRQEYGGEVPEEAFIPMDEEQRAVVSSLDSHIYNLSLALKNDQTVVEAFRDTLAKLKVAMGKGESTSTVSILDPYMAAVVPKSKISSAYVTSYFSIKDRLVEIIKKLKLSTHIDVEFQVRQFISIMEEFEGQFSSIARYGIDDEKHADVLQTIVSQPHVMAMIELFKKMNCSMSFLQFAVEYQRQPQAALDSLKKCMESYSFSANSRLISALENNNIKELDRAYVYLSRRASIRYSDAVHFASKSSWRQQRINTIFSPACQLAHQANIQTSALDEIVDLSYRTKPWVVRSPDSQLYISLNRKHVDGLTAEDRTLLTSLFKKEDRVLSAHVGKPSIIPSHAFWRWYHATFIAEHKACNLGLYKRFFLKESSPLSMGFFNKVTKAVTLLKAEDFDAECVYYSNKYDNRLHKTVTKQLVYQSELINILVDACRALKTSRQAVFDETRVAHKIFDILLNSAVALKISVLRFFESFFSVVMLLSPQFHVSSHFRNLVFAMSNRGIEDMIVSIIKRVYTSAMPELLLADNRVVCIRYMRCNSLYKAVEFLRDRKYVSGKEAQTIVQQSDLDVDSLSNLLQAVSIANAQAGAIFMTSNPNQLQSLCKNTVEGDPVFYYTNTMDQNIYCAGWKEIQAVLNASGDAQDSVAMKLGLSKEAVKDIIKTFKVKQDDFDAISSEVLYELNSKIPKLPAPIVPSDATSAELRKHKEACATYEKYIAEANAFYDKSPLYSANPSLFDASEYPQCKKIIDSIISDKSKDSPLLMGLRVVAFRDLTQKLLIQYFNIVVSSIQQEFDNDNTFLTAFMKDLDQEAKERAHKYGASVVITGEEEKALESGIPTNIDREAREDVIMTRRRKLMTEKYNKALALSRNDQTGRVALLKKRYFGTFIGDTSLEEIIAGATGMQSLYLTNNVIDYLTSLRSKYEFPNEVAFSFTAGDEVLFGVCDICHEKSNTMSTYVPSGDKSQEFVVRNICSKLQCWKTAFDSDALKTFSIRQMKKIEIENDIKSLIQCTMNEGELLQYLSQIPTLKHLTIAQGSNVRGALWKSALDQCTDLAFNDNAVQLKATVIGKLYSAFASKETHTNPRDQLKALMGMNKFCEKVKEVAALYQGEISSRQVSIDESLKMLFSPWGDRDSLMNILQTTFNVGREAVEGMTLDAMHYYILTRSISMPVDIMKQRASNIKQVVYEMSKLFSMSSSEINRISTASAEEQFNFIVSNDEMRRQITSLAKDALQRAVSTAMSTLDYMEKAGNIVSDPMPGCRTITKKYVQSYIQVYMSNIRLSAIRDYIAKHYDASLPEIAPLHSLLQQAQSFNDFVHAFESLISSTRAKASQVSGSGKPEVVTVGTVKRKIVKKGDITAEDRQKIVFYESLLKIVKETEWLSNNFSFQAMIKAFLDEHGNDCIVPDRAQSSSDRDFMIAKQILRALGVIAFGEYSQASPLQTVIEVWTKGNKGEAVELKGKFENIFQASDFTNDSLDDIRLALKQDSKSKANYVYKSISQADEVETVIEVYTKKQNGEPDKLLGRYTSVNHASDLTNDNPEDIHLALRDDAKSKRESGVKYYYKYASHVRKAPKSSKGDRAAKFDKIVNAYYTDRDDLMIAIFECCLVNNIPLEALLQGGVQFESLIPKLDALPDKLDSYLESYPNVRIGGGKDRETWKEASQFYQSIMKVMGKLESVNMLYDMPLVDERNQIIAVPDVPAKFIFWTESFASMTEQDREIGREKAHAMHQRNVPRKEREELTRHSAMFFITYSLPCIFLHASSAIGVRDLQYDIERNPLNFSSDIGKNASSALVNIITAGKTQLLKNIKKMRDDIRRSKERRIASPPLVGVKQAWEIADLNTIIQLKQSDAELMNVQTQFISQMHTLLVKVFNSEITPLMGLSEQGVERARVLQAILNDVNYICTKVYGIQSKFTEYDEQVLEEDFTEVLKTGYIIDEDTGKYMKMDRDVSLQTCKKHPETYKIGKNNKCYKFVSAEEALERVKSGKLVKRKVKSPAAAYAFTVPKREDVLVETNMQITRLGVSLSGETYPAISSGVTIGSRISKEEFEFFNFDLSTMYDNKVSQLTAELKTPAVMKDKQKDREIRTLIKSLNQRKSDALLAGVEISSIDFVERAASIDISKEISAALAELDKEEKKQVAPVASTIMAVAEEVSEEPEIGDIELELDEEDGFIIDDGPEIAPDENEQQLGDDDDHNWEEHDDVE